MTTFETSTNAKPSDTNTDDDQFPHIFCWRCAPPPGEKSTAICSTPARRKGIKVTLPFPGLCLVCEDLCHQPFKCPKCGYVNPPVRRSGDS